MTQLLQAQIRFARYGRKKLPFYRLVAIDTRKSRDSKPIEVRWRPLEWCYVSSPQHQCMLYQLFDMVVIVEVNHVVVGFPRRPISAAFRSQFKSAAVRNCLFIGWYAPLLLALFTSVTEQVRHVYLCWQFAHVCVVVCERERGSEKVSEVGPLLVERCTRECLKDPGWTQSRSLKLDSMLCAVPWMVRPASKGDQLECAIHQEVACRRRKTLRNSQPSTKTCDGHRLGYFPAIWAG